MKVASWHTTSRWPTSEEVDDILAHLARYLRVPWEYLERQTFARLNEMMAACSRLIRAENGKRPTLDLTGASEENR